VHVFGLAITSRNPRNPLWLALICGLLAWALPMPDRRRAVTRAWRRFADLALSPHEGTGGMRWVAPGTMVALAAVAAEVYFWAGARPLWLDEQLVALNLRDRTFAELAGPLWLGQGAPFGWLVLQRAALVSLGTSELALRLAPMLSGCAMLAVAAWVSRRTMSRSGAALFVLLCAVGQWLAHYAFELKHYSADGFWGLLLPALTLWVMEAALPAERQRRLAAWWAAALIGHWLAYGALLVTPACALILLADEWRRGGWGSGLRFSLMGTIWLASFGLHYLVSLGATATNEDLRGYWAAGFPPDGSGTVDTWRWMTSRLAPLAINPGGTEHWTFWLVAACGFTLAGRRWGIVLASIPLAALAFAVLRLVPLNDRLALWMVPSLYLGLAFFVDRGLRWACSPAVRSRGLRLLMAVSVIVLAGPVCADIVARGWREYRFGRWPDGNHGVDDRAAVRWLIDQRRPGDALLTTRLGAPAFWWYGAIPISGPSAGGTLPDGTPIFEVGLRSAGDCGADRLRVLLAGRRRVLVYSGFPDQPAGFDVLLLARLSEFGAVIAERRFAIAGHAAVLELTAAPGVTAAGAAASTIVPQVALNGCIEGAMIRRW
jgi:hypothetical protein